MTEDIDLGARIRAMVAVDETPTPAPRRRIPPRLIDWSKQPLGKMPDGALAKILGVSDMSVLEWRKRLGIPSYREQLDAMLGEEPLGFVPDTEIAAKLGVSHATVIGARKRRGIESSQDRRRRKARAMKRVGA